MVLTVRDRPHGSSHFARPGYRPPDRKKDPFMTRVDAVTDPNEPAWRERAVSRSVDAARSRAEQRVQRFLEAAFELIDEKGTTEFTIQEVTERSKQSLRSFYEYF